MDDLISRAALLHSLNEQAPKPTTDDLYTVNLCIINAPTIDAIPMWWITEKFLDVLNKGKELSKAVWLVRKAWQKEQEAR
jgi:hypothetical protein